jgi:hypothetical protein
MGRTTAGRYTIILKRVLIVSVTAEALTGVALFVLPAAVARLILGAEVEAGGRALARLFALALFSLVAAYWPCASSDATVAAANRGLFTYNVTVAVYLAYLWARGTTVGALLLPAAAFHTIVSLLLAGLSIGIKQALPSNRPDRS